MNFIFNLLARLLPTRRVDVIVRQLGVLAQRLADAEARQADKAAAIGRQIASLRDTQMAAIDEADRAARVSAKINDLIN